MSGESFTVACVQNCAGTETEPNLKDCAELVHQAADQGASFILLPEYFTGLDIRAPGFNVFVCGLRGNGRLHVVRELLQQVQPRANTPRDILYAHNPDRPDEPRLLRSA